MRKNYKILFASHEIGGQMQLMVEELRRRGYFASAASYNQEWFGHINDIQIDLTDKNRKLRRHLLILSFTLWAAQNYDIFHFFWGSSLYGFGPFPHIDLPILRKLGKKIFVHFRGLDIIDLKYFDYLRARNAGDELIEPPISRPDQQRRLSRWRRYSHKMLVSEPDLLRVVPEAVLVQQAIDLEYWQSESSTIVAKKNGSIRIAHAPSLRRKKGTEFIQDAIIKLKELGYPVELILIEKVPFDRVKSLYETCDLGIDQVLYGWYGKVSIELMALGKPVVCFIDPQWLSFRADLPIINAKPDNLVERLIPLIENVELRLELARSGKSYVKKHHDVSKIIDQCLEIYQDSF